MTADREPCVFVPPHEPWSCKTHLGGTRMRLDQDRCRPIARARQGHWSWCALTDIDHDGPCEAVAENVVLHIESYPSPGESSGFDAEVKALRSAFRAGGARLHEETWHVNDDDLDGIAAALASTPEPAPVAEGLDVERLAWAMHDAGAMCYEPRSFCKTEWIGDERHDVHIRWAAALADRYAAASPSPETE